MTAHDAEPNFVVSMPTAHVASQPFEDKLGEVLRRSLPTLGPEARAQVEALIDRETLIVVAAVLVAWVVSHAFGVGEIIDAVLVAQVGGNGFSQFFKGIRFPVDNGYMNLFRGGGYSSVFCNNGLIPEAAALLYNGTVVGIGFELWFQNSSAHVRPPVATEATT